MRRAAGVLFLDDVLDLAGGAGLAGAGGEAGGVGERDRIVGGVDIAVQGLGIGQVPGRGVGAGEDGPGGSVVPGGKMVQAGPGVVLLALRLAAWCPMPGGSLGRRRQSRPSRPRSWPL